MHYEHLIQINDLNDPLLTSMTRGQLWRGLLRRVEQPQEFLVNVEHVAILERGEGWLKREMLLGNLRVEDHITLEHERRIHFVTAPSEQHQGGTFTMTIEEPNPGDLFVRFGYVTALPEGGGMDTEAGDAYFADFIKSAYRDTDVDTIRWIRELLETGELD
ncbi:SRPBCC family protein [Chitinimonas sp.]|uniref:SRPBCC family protein n=1 Tax=Chitinimonas sp. TaxID=1934313 RepID=UPI002F928546